MKFQLEVDYEDGTEVYELTEKETNKILQYNRINLNAMLQMAKRKHKEFDSGIKGDIKE